MSAESISDDDFQTFISDGDTPVVIDFWAEWCGPCKQMSPHLDAVAGEMNGKVKVGKLNVDDNPMTAGQYGVRGLPTLMLFKNGKVAATHLGAMSKQRIAEWIKESL